QVAFGIAAETPAFDPALAALGQLGSQPRPSLAVATDQVLDPLGLSPRRNRRDDACRASQHQRRRCYLPPAGPPLVVPVTGEQLLQGVVGPRQILHLVTVEQPRPVTPA